MITDEIRKKLKKIDNELDNEIISEISSKIGTYIAALRGATAYYVSDELSKEDYYRDVEQWKGEIEKNTKEKIAKMGKLYGDLAEELKNLPLEERKRIESIIFEFYSKEDPSVA